MKKSLIALAALAAVGAASAQSSVTLFGIVDAGLQYGRGSGAGSANKTQLGSNGYNTSRLGFRGTEDLGGGLAASFWLEAAVLPDTGEGAATNVNNQPIAATVPAVRSGTQGLTFGRRATVSLASGFGELRLGRDYVPQFWNHTVFDPFGTNGAGTSQSYAGSTAGTTLVRASNSIGYFLPANLGGIYGQAQYYLGENVQNGAVTEDDGNGYGLRLGYAAGPVNVAAAYGKTDNSVTGDVKVANIGASYDLGVAKLLGNYNQDKVGTAKQKGFVVGALVPVGAGEIRASYSQTKADQGAEAKTKKYALGYVHNLSKRTAVYTTIARVNNDNGAAVALNGATISANGNSTGFDLGLRHSF